MYFEGKSRGASKFHLFVYDEERGKRYKKKIIIIIIVIKSIQIVIIIG